MSESYGSEPASSCVESKVARRSRLRTEAVQWPSSPLCRTLVPSSACGAAVMWQPLKAIWTIFPHLCLCRGAAKPLPSRSPDSAPMSADKVTYLDSSAIVKLIVREPESEAYARTSEDDSPL